MATSFRFFLWWFAAAVRPAMVVSAAQPPKLVVHKALPSASAELDSSKAREPAASGNSSTEAASASSVQLLPTLGLPLGLYDMVDVGAPGGLGSPSSCSNASSGSSLVSMSLLTRSTTNSSLFSLGGSSSEDSSVASARPQSQSTVQRSFFNNIPRWWTTASFLRNSKSPACSDTSAREVGGKLGGGRGSRKKEKRIVAPSWKKRLKMRLQKWGLITLITTQRKGKRRDYNTIFFFMRPGGKKSLDDGADEDDDSDQQSGVANEMLVALCPPRPPPARNTAPAEKKSFSRCEERIKERSSAQMQLKEPAPRTMLMRSLPQTFSKRDCGKEAATREQLPSGELSKLLLGAMPAAKLPRWARWWVPRRWNHCRRFLLQLLQCEKVDAILFINDPEVECALLPWYDAEQPRCGSASGSEGWPQEELGSLYLPLGTARAPSLESCHARLPRRLSSMSACEGGAAPSPRRDQALRMRRWSLLSPANPAASSSAAGRRGETQTSCFAGLVKKPSSRRGRSESCCYGGIMRGRSRASSSFGENLLRKKPNAQETSPDSPTAPLVNCEQDGEKGRSACESDDDARRSGSQRVVGDDDEYDNDTAVLAEELLLAADVQEGLDLSCPHDIEITQTRGQVFSCRAEATAEGEEEDRYQSPLHLQEPLQEERIDLQERHGVYEGAAFVHAHLAVKDHVPLTLNELDATADLLARWIDRGKRVYVHCKAGKARSAMAVCALMLKFAKVEADGNEDVSAEVLCDEKLEHDGDRSCEQEIRGRLPKKEFRPCSVDEALAVLRMRRPATRKLATKPDKYEAMVAYADQLNHGSSGERFRRYRYRHVDVATSTWSEDEADDQACSSSVENLPFSFVLGVADVVMEAEAEKSKGNCCGDRGSLYFADGAGVGIINSDEAEASNCEAEQEVGLVDALRLLSVKDTPLLRAEDLRCEK